MRKRLVWQFSFISAAYFAALAGGSYLTTYLKDYFGFSGTEIGTLVAIGSALAVVFSPIFGAISDKIGSSRKVFIAGGFGCGLLYLILPILGWSGVKTIGPFCLVVPLVYLFRLPTNALLDSWTNSEIAPHNINYGIIRRWGSFGFAVISLFMGAVLVPFDISLAFVSCFLLMLPWVLYAFKMKETVPLAPKDKREKLQIGKLFTNYYFMTYVVLTFAINIYLGITLVFYPYILAHANVNSDYLGLVIGFRALVEMGSMSLTGKLRKVIPLPYLVAVSGLLFGVENLIYSGAGSLVALLCGVVMSGLASGIAFSQGPAYVQDIVPNELKSTAQVFNAMTMSIVSIAGTFFGGRIIDQYGIAAFNGGLSVIIFCIFLFFVLSLFLGKKVFHFELHSNQREQEKASRSAVSD